MSDHPLDVEEYLRSLPRIIFFTGKGGVGKTSIACATSVALAERGKRVLVVSTDPASNLDEVLGTPLKQDPTAVLGAIGLFALNIDPAAAARDYREKIVEPYRGVLPDTVLASMEEQLSGACTVEIAAFNEFAKLLSDVEQTENFDYLIFDTAPTGHTLRLLKLPGAWSEFLATNTSGTSCLGPLQGLKEQQTLYEACVANLADSSLTQVVLVSRPEGFTLAEAQRTSNELTKLDISNQVLVVNGVFMAADQADEVAIALQGQGELALSLMAPNLASLPMLEVPLLGFAPLGVSDLRRVFQGRKFCEPEVSLVPTIPFEGPSLFSLIDAIESLGPGVVLTMGKGGVGKTTIAAAIALELAHRGHPVHLTTTDPAAHLASVVSCEVPNLRLTRIDPAIEIQRYSAEVRTQSASLLDAEGKAVLDEDLRSPCTEEIAVFQAFARVVAQGEKEFVIVDTAPTGHTILLLDAAESYHREVLRTGGNTPEAVRQLLPRLRDPLFTRVILIALPEATPIHEASHLQEDLKRAGIVPFAWIVNQSFAARRLKDPTLRSRGLREVPYLHEVRDSLSRRFAVIPWQSSSYARGFLK